MITRLVLIAVVLTAACTSGEVRRKCANAADPAACQRAEAAQQRQIDGERLEQNTMRGGGGY